MDRSFQARKNCSEFTHALGPFPRMSDEDLEALWLYLHSLDPVEHDVGPIVYKKEK